MLACCCCVEWLILCQPVSGLSSSTQQILYHCAWSLNRRCQTVYTVVFKTVLAFTQLCTMPSVFVLFSGNEAKMFWCSFLLNDRCLWTVCIYAFYNSTYPATVTFGGGRPRRKVPSLTLCIAHVCQMIQNHAQSFVEASGRIQWAGGPGLPLKSCVLV